MPGRGVASYPLQHSDIHSPARYRRTRRTSCRSATAERCGRRSYSGGISTRCCLISTAASMPVRPTAASLPTTALTLSTAPNRNRRRRSAPNLDCDLCGSCVGCDLFRHTYGMSAPWPTAFFSWRTPERAAHPLRPSCRAMSTRIQIFLGETLALLSCASSSLSLIHI